MDYRILLLAPIAALVFSANATPPRMPDFWLPVDLVNPASPSPQAPVGYEIGLDSQAAGPASLTVRSVLPQGTQRQSIGAAHQLVFGYGGQRVRLSGQVRAEGPTAWAGLYIGAGDVGLLSDMAFGKAGIENRLPRGAAVRPGSGWQNLSVVFDVPAGAPSIDLGLALVGEGQAWVRELRFDVVEPEAPVTVSTLAYDWASARVVMENSRRSIAKFSPGKLQNPALD